MSVQGGTGKKRSLDELASTYLKHDSSEFPRTPQVYYEGDYIRNLESELARASKLKCSTCGLKGAGLGCFMKSYRRSYHVPCAIETSDCRWDFMLYTDCLLHL